ncbi:hypothetical protein F5Y15DRAFT_401644 [Xylariaceae sp. FL0016]|nr:hypothetical protein F5Y15DRAFT_401644 [Xylariaceae sp. FL0016]
MHSFLVLCILYTCSLLPVVFAQVVASFSWGLDGSALQDSTGLHAYPLVVLGVVVAGNVVRRTLTAVFGHWVLRVGFLLLGGFDPASFGQAPFP